MACARCVLPRPVAPYITSGLNVLPPKLFATDIAAARLLLYRACAIKDAGKPFSAEAAMAKLFCSAVATRVTNLAVQIHGGYGYIKDFPVERYYRDARITEIYEGTREIQKNTIASSVIGKRG